MAVQANYRIQKTRIYILAVAIAIVLAVVLYIRVGTESARIVMEAIGTIAVTLVIAQFIVEKWLWKTKIGSVLGFPPDYSGVWKGTIHRLKNNDSETPTDTKIEVVVKQTITQIEWNQVGYSMDGVRMAESHFIVGEVIDYHRKWDGIAGVYEVKRQDGKKEEGMELVTVNESGDEITGLYCGMNGNVGKMTLNKVKD